MVPDNFLASCLFDNIDLYVNHELLTSKSSNADNYLTDFFLSRQLYNQPYSNTVFEVCGYYSDKNIDASEFNASLISARRRASVVVTKTDSKGVQTTWHRYDLCMPINLGIGKQEIPCPTNVPIQITFNRAAATKALLQTATKNSDNAPNTYSETVIPLISPILSAYFVESAKADGFYSKARLYDISVPFLDYNIRRELLLDQISDHKVKLFEGTSDL